MRARAVGSAAILEGRNAASSRGLCVRGTSATLSATPVRRTKMSVVKSEVPRQGSLVPEAEPGLIGMLERLAQNPDVPVDKLERLLEMQERISAKQAES